MHTLQALVQGKVTPQMISIDHLIEMAKCYNDPHSAEYKLIELATNILLAQALDQALKHV